MGLENIGLAAQIIIEPGKSIRDLKALHGTLSTVETSLYGVQMALRGTSAAFTQVSRAMRGVSESRLRGIARGFDAITASANAAAAAMHAAAAGMGHAGSAGAGFAAGAGRGRRTAGAAAVAGGALVPYGGRGMAEVPGQPRLGYTARARRYDPGYVINDYPRLPGPVGGGYGDRIIDAQYVGGGPPRIPRRPMGSVPRRDMARGLGYANQGIMNIRYGAGPALFAGSAMAYAAGSEFFDYERQVARAGAVFGREQYGKIGPDIRMASKGIGAKLGIMPSAVAASISEAARAGVFDRKELRGIAMPAAQLSLLEGMPVEEALASLAGIGATFGRKDYGKLAAELSRASDISLASIPSISQAMQYLGPSARTSGFGATETMAAVSAIQKFDVKGTKAGTWFANLVQQLSKTEKRKKVENVLQRSMLTDQGKFRSFGGMIDDVVEAIQIVQSTKGEAAAAEFANSISNMRGMRAAMIMNILGAGSVAAHQASIGNVTVDAFNDKVNVANETYGAQLMRLLSTGSGMMASVLEGGKSTGLGWLTGVADRWGQTGGALAALVEGKAPGEVARMEMEGGGVIGMQAVENAQAIQKSMEDTFESLKNFGSFAKDTLGFLFGPPKENAIGVFLGKMTLLSPVLMSIAAATSAISGIVTGGYKIAKGIGQFSDSAMGVDYFGGMAGRFKQGFAGDKSVPIPGMAMFGGAGGRAMGRAKAAWRNFRSAPTMGARMGQIGGGLKGMVSGGASMVGSGAKALAAGAMAALGPLGLLTAAIAGLAAVSGYIGDVLDEATARARERAITAAIEHYGEQGTETTAERMGYHAGTGLGGMVGYSFQQRKGKTYKKSGGMVEMAAMLKIAGDDSQPATRRAAAKSRLTSMLNDVVGSESLRKYGREETVGRVLEMVGQTAGVSATGIEGLKAGYMADLSSVKDTEAEKYAAIGKGMFVPDSMQGISGFFNRVSGEMGKVANTARDASYGLFNAGAAADAFAYSVNQAASRIFGYAHKEIRVPMAQAVERAGGAVNFAAQAYGIMGGKMAFGVKLPQDPATTAAAEGMLQRRAGATLVVPPKNTKLGKEYRKEMKSQAKFDAAARAWIQGDVSATNRLFAEIDRDCLNANIGVSLDGKVIASTVARINNDVNSRGGANTPPWQKSRVVEQGITK